MQGPQKISMLLALSYLYMHTATHQDHRNEPNAYSRGSKEATTGHASKAGCITFEVERVQLLYGSHYKRTHGPSNASFPVTLEWTTLKCTLISKRVQRSPKGHYSTYNLIAMEVN